MIPDRTVHTPRHPAEPPEVRDDGQGDGGKDDVLRAFAYAFRPEDEVVEEVCEHEDGEVEGWELLGRR